MSREIKFRAWDGKQMLSEDNYDFVVSSYDSIIHLGEYDWTETGVDCVEQYTGLKDKNGKEIYEGDIVRWVDDHDENAYINFDEGCFWVSWPINSERINGEMADDLEVIGNIHENPELLGGEK